MDISTVRKAAVNSLSVKRADVKNSLSGNEVSSSDSAAPSDPDVSADTQDIQHEIVCAWVPGTTDRIRFTLFRQGQQKVRELAVAKLAAMFGRSVMDDLYLRGRARLRLSERQLLELA